MRGWWWRLGLAAVLLGLYLQLGYLAGVLWWSRFDPANTAFMAAGLDRLQEKKRA